MTALSILATLQAGFGDLDRIERFLKVFGMVNVAPGFNRTPAVLDGCSDLLVEVFGEAGRHTRSAVGMAELPFDIAVEIELIARLRPPGAPAAAAEPAASTSALDRYYGAYAGAGDAGEPGHVVAQREPRATTSPRSLRSRPSSCTVACSSASTRRARTGSPTSWRRSSSWPRSWGS